MIIFVLSVRTPGLCVTLTSSKLQSAVNFEKFQSVMLQSTDAEASTLLEITKGMFSISFRKELRTPLSGDLARKKARNERPSCFTSCSEICYLHRLKHKEVTIAV